MSERREGRSSEGLRIFTGHGSKSRTATPLRLPWLVATDSTAITYSSLGFLIVVAFPSQPILFALLLPGLRLGQRLALPRVEVAHGLDGEPCLQARRRSCEEVRACGDRKTRARREERNGAKWRCEYAGDSLGLSLTLRSTQHGAADCWCNTSCGLCGFVRERGEGGGGQGEVRNSKKPVCGIIHCC